MFQPYCNEAKRLRHPSPEPLAAAFYTHLSFVPEQNMLVALGRDHIARCLLVKAR